MAGLLPADVKIVHALWIINDLKCFGDDADLEMPSKMKFTINLKWNLAWKLERLFFCLKPAESISIACKLAPVRRYGG